MRRSLTILALFVTTSTLARAEINIVDSLEWMSVDARLIVRGKVVRCEDTKGPGDVTYRDATIEVAQVVKGKVEGRTVAVRLRLLGKDGTGLDWKESGHPYLFFLTQGNPADDKNLAGCWVTRGHNYEVIDLEKPAKVYTSDMKKAENAKEILALVTKYAAVPVRPDVGPGNVGKPRPGSLVLEVPFDAPIFNELWAGSSVLMVVPADEKRLALALANVRSKNVHERAVGAKLLRHYPGKDTVKVLMELLTDPGEVQSIGAGGKVEKVYYPVRQEAYQSLLDLGEKPAKPVLERGPAAGDNKDK
jgi:hypothetical protein